MFTSFHFWAVVRAAEGKFQEERSIDRFFRTPPVIALFLSLFRCVLIICVVSSEAVFRKSNVGRHSPVVCVFLTSDFIHSDGFFRVREEGSVPKRRNIFFCFCLRVSCLWPVLNVWS